MASEAEGRAPAVILVEPQLGENIGMVARAMLNCGLTDLRLVRPRDGWPNSMAVKAAAGADAVLEAARVYQETAEAAADLHRLYATTARPRGMVKPLASPREAALEMREASTRGERVGLIFGGEKAGLSNQDVAYADVVVEVPLNPRFRSLNLAQAVLVLGYEWFQAGEDSALPQPGSGLAPPAEKAQFDNFFDRLVAILDQEGFFYPPEKRPGMIRSLRNLFSRMSPSDQDLRTLHGIVSALLGAKRRGEGR
jgi:tRNA/rRNA methyltransferase